MFEIHMKLISLRESKKITRTKIYNFLGVTRQTYNSYETGKAVPSLKILIKIAEFYNVSLDYLVGRSPLEWDNIITYQHIEISNAILSCGLDPEDIQNIFQAIKNSIDKINK